MSTKAKPQEENPLLNILINVIAPVIILSQMSKQPDAIDGKLWHVGPTYAMYAALALPLGYGIYHFIKTRKCNIFSLVGILSVLLTGVITIVIWNKPELRSQSALLFGIKEAVQPLILGSLFLITHRTKTPLFNAFIYNDALFNIKKIEKEVELSNSTDHYKKLLWTCTLMFFGSFLISSVLNMGVAYYFLGDLDPAATNWEELFNEKVGAIMGWGFAIIGAPLMLIGMFILYFLIRGLKKITHFELEALLLPR